MIAATVNTNAAERALDQPEAVVRVPESSSPRHRRSGVIRRALALSDVIGLTIAFLASFALSNHHGTPMGSSRFVAETALFILTLPLWLVFAKTLDLYARDEARADHSTADEAIGVISLVTLGTWVVFVSAWATGLSHPQLGRLIGFWAFALTFVLAGRVVVRAVTRRTAAYQQHGLVLGAGDVGQLVGRKLQHPPSHVRVLGFVDADPADAGRASRTPADPRLPNEIVDIVRRHASTG